MLEKVQVSSEVHRSCMTHALSTSKEEVMGLLIGEIVPKNGDDIDQKNGEVDQKNGEVVGEDDNQETFVLEIVGLKIFQRLDKRKDRVEIRYKNSFTILHYSTNFTRYSY